MAKEKFAAHRVLDRVGYGIGVRLQLSASQIADRRHALTTEDEKAGIVTVTEPIEFRAGEEIGIAHALSRHEEAALEAVDIAAVKKVRSSSGTTVPATSGVVDTPAGDSTEDAGADKDEAGNADANESNDGTDADDDEEEGDEQGNGDAG